MSQVRTSSIRVPRHSQKLYILPILIAMCGSNHTKKEKEGLQRLDVYESISKKQYLHLKCTGRVGKALPSMCVLVIKPDKDGNPVRAKSRIVVLGNFEDRYYTKSQYDKLTVVRSPTGNPEYNNDTYWLLNKTLYACSRLPSKTWVSPRHSTIPVSSLAPSASASASGKPLTSTQPPSPDVPSAPATPHSSDSPALVHVGIYVDDFVFYSTDPAQETLFMEALKQGAVIDFMGPVYWFFRTAFTWKRHDDGWPSLRSSLSIRLY
eukprot:scaffold10518_cov43-Cyclotella_meneghiniana.AAC.4